MVVYFPECVFLSDSSFFWCDELVKVFFLCARVSLPLIYPTCLQLSFRWCRIPFFKSMHNIYYDIIISTGSYMYFIQALLVTHSLQIHTRTNWAGTWDQFLPDKPVSLKHVFSLNFVVFISNIKRMYMCDTTSLLIWVVFWRLRSACTSRCHCSCFHHSIVWSCLVYFCVHSLVSESIHSRKEISKMIKNLLLNFLCVCFRRFHLSILSHGFPFH